ncbi:MAG: DUF362 domain-containing protein [Defluviitaleaceae bacterium]|nr:DUF362 domain-containing protein [Defluviitaleaceae bacterium]
MKKFIYGVLVVIFAVGGVIAVVNSATEYGVRRAPVSPQIAPAAQVRGVEREPSPFGDAFRRETDSVVSIVQAHEVERAEDLTFADVAVLVREAVAIAGGLEGIVGDGDVVVLKPNLVTARCNTLPGWQGRWLPPEANGNTTDYRVTRAVAQIVRELNPTGRIYVMEGSAHDTTDVFRRMNYIREHIPEVDDFFALDRVSGEWRDRESPYLIRVDAPNGLFRDYYYFNRLFFEADVLINLPTLKNHWETVTTGAVKNLGIGATPANIYGNSPSDNHRLREIPHGVPGLHQFIADYYTLRPSDFVVMDALQGLSHGPTPSYAMSGIRDIADAQKNMRSILASSDGLAIDVVQTNIMNWDIDTVFHLQYLIEAGVVGNGHSRDILVLGNARVDDLRTDFGGVTPRLGGSRLSPAAPPEISILPTTDFHNGYLHLRLNLCQNTDKIDIYLDGFYLTSVGGNFSDFAGFAEISLDMRGLFAKNREVTVYAFDNRMRHSSDSRRVEAEELPYPPARDYLVLRIDHHYSAVYHGGDFRADTLLDAAPFIVGGRTMVPFRFIGEALGAEIDWNADTQFATFITADGEHLALQINTALYDESGNYMGTPVIVKGHTFVPVRFVSEIMGAEVIWDAEARSITIPLN